MARHISGVFVRVDRVAVAPGTTVRLLTPERKLLGRAELVELGTSVLRLSSSSPPELGAKVLVAITLPNRYIEFEVPGLVDWERGQEFGITLDYLSARQAYGISLARELLGVSSGTPALAAPAPRARRR